MHDIKIILVSVITENHIFVHISITAHCLIIIVESVRVYLVNNQVKQLKYW